MSKSRKSGKVNPYLQDYFAKKAKKENFAARSAFKLEELDHKHRLFKKNQWVLDLGAAPGSWSQYSSQKVGLSGKVIGIDLQNISIQLPNATFIQGDLLEQTLPDLMKTQNIEFHPFDLVLSDMAPKTTGIKITDQMKSLELCEMALNIAVANLKPGGHFVCKLFHSDEFHELKAQIQKHFQKFDALKPKSTRKISKEIFLVGLGFKN